jgi:hypothetical protein
LEDANNVSTQAGNERTHSLSGRALEDNEFLNSSGYGRRKQSIAAQAIGSSSIKIQKLPQLPFLALKPKDKD